MMKRESNVREEPSDEAATQLQVTKNTDYRLSLQVTKTTWMETNIKKARWSKSHGDSSAQKNVAC